MTISLKMENITKGFTNKPIFKNISLNFERGCYSIVGQNGEGKSVLLEMLAGVVPQNTGSIYLNDTIINTSIEYKNRLAFIPSKPLFFPSTTGLEFLNFILSIKKQRYAESKVDELISKFKLTNHLNTKFSNMSLGTQKKLFLTTLGIGNNSVIILDEPTNGLDSESNIVLYDLLYSLKDSAIIILATHDTHLIKKLSPLIIDLNKSTTSYLEINAAYRYIDYENVL